jgi:hypothetical protein
MFASSFFGVFASFSPSDTDDAAFLVLQIARICSANSDSGLLGGGVVLASMQDSKTVVEARCGETGTCKTACNGLQRPDRPASEGYEVQGTVAERASAVMNRACDIPRSLPNSGGIAWRLEERSTTSLRDCRCNASRGRDVDAIDVRANHVYELNHRVAVVLVVGVGMRIGRRRL